MVNRINQLNTLFFGDDIERLLSVKGKIIFVLSNKKEQYYYTDLIISSKAGWFLEINVYPRIDAAKGI
jgi:hypothetical protein